MSSKKQLRVYLLVALGYLLFLATNYWTLLSGNNLMKWDIIQAEYPLQVMMSDAISNGTLPLWNPLMNMGMPYYSTIGMPVWYPITLLLAFWGYTPWTISLEYIMHLYLAAYGMFLLAGSFLKGKRGKAVIAFIAGLIYCSSGLFLSNAEHIMLVISATWYPYVFYSIKRYIEEKRIVFMLLGALFAGLIITGGYPEMFYNLFLVLVPYFVYLMWNTNKSIWQNIFAAAGKYLLLCICTITSCAITILPFIHVMPYITRTANAEQPVTVVPFVNLLSMLVPSTGFLLSNCEISMCNYYTSIFAFILLACLPKGRSKKKWGFACIAIFCFLMSLGEYSPFYMLCHKYLPMYATFRFPSVFRPLITIFFLIILIEGLENMLHGQINRSSIFFTAGLAAFGIWGIWIVKRYAAGRISIPLWNTLVPESIFYNSMKAIVIISIVYIILLVLMRKKNLNFTFKTAIMIFAVTLELSIFIQVELPITVVSYDVSAAKNDSDIINAVQNWYKENKDRNRNGNFSGNTRYTTKYLENTKHIVFEKCFDEEGYLSIKLERTEQYKQSYNRSIIEANPVAYFTNDIVDSSQSTLEAWRMKGNVPRSQVYIEDPIVETLQDSEMKIDFAPEVLENAQGKVNIEGKMICFEGDIPAIGDMSRCIIVWLEPTKTTKCYLNTYFEDITGVQNENTDTYTIKHDEGQPYIELFFPDTTQDYSKIQVSTQQVSPENIEVRYTERMATDNYVSVNHFNHNNISMSIQAPSDGYVVILQSYYPGWKAYIDGQESEIQTVNGCFIGLPIREGIHNISLEFRPLDFFIGAGITGTFLAFLLLSVVWDVVKQRKELILCQ